MKRIFLACVMTFLFSCSVSPSMVEPTRWPISPDAQNSDPPDMISTEIPTLVSPFIRSTDRADANSTSGEVAAMDIYIENVTGYLPLTHSSIGGLKEVARLQFVGLGGVAWSPDGSLLAINLPSGVHVVTPFKQGKLESLAFSPSARPIPFNSHLGPIEFSPDGSLLAAGDLGGVYEWKVTSDFLDSRYLPAGGWVRSLDYINDQHEIAYTTPQGTLLVSSGSVSSLGSGFHYSVSASPDNSLMATVGEDGINIWSTISGELLFEAEGSAISSDFASDGSYLIAGSHLVAIEADLSFKNFRLETSDNVWAVTFIPQSHLAAIGLTNGAVEIWNVDEAKLLTTVDAHEGSVMFIEASKDGKWLATSGFDHDLAIWGVSGNR